MLWFHPVLQAVVTLLSLYVLYMGLLRFCSIHLGMKTVFPWKNHVQWGLVVVLLWLSGAIGGRIMTGMIWGAAGATQTHYRVGLTMMPLLLFSLATGWFMDRKKARRKVLPLLHGLSGVTLVILALWQVWTGVGVIRNFLLD